MQDQQSDGKDNIQRLRVQAALLDISDGLSQWRRVWVLAWNDVQQRYRRSRVGQFWLTISMAVSIAGIGLVFSGIFAQPLSDYIVFLGGGIVVWGLLSTAIIELSTSCTSSEHYLKSYPGPRSIVIYRTILRNLIIFGHNIIILPLLWIITGRPLSWSILLIIPGLILIIINFGWLGLLLGPLSARFRDIPQIIVSLMQLLFFVTPVIYRPSQMPPHLTFLSTYNPLSNAMEVVRAPLLGTVPDIKNYIGLIILAIVGYAVAIPFYARFRARIVYWL